MKKFLSITLLACLLIACKTETKEAQENTNDVLPFTQLLDNYYEDGLKLNPLNATMAGDNRYNDLFPDVLSKEYKQEATAHYKKYLFTIAAYKDENLTKSEKLSKAILSWDCEVNIELLNSKKDLMPMDQMWSPHLMIGQLASGASAQPFKTASDYYNWEKRVDGYLSWLSSAEKNMRQGIQEGYVLPKSLIKKVIPQMQAMTVTDVEKHLFYQPIVNMPSDISSEDKKAITTAYKAMITDKIIPAHQRMADFFSGDYMDAGRASSGYSELPNGSDYYDFAIKYFTTTTMSANEIHELGLSEVARIRSAMEKVKEQVGFKGDLKAFFDHVRSSKDLMPFTTPEQVIANFNKMHETMKPKVNELFSLQPKTPFEVRQTEAFREKSASAEYNPGSLDGTRPGIFYTPIPDASTYNVYSDESLCLHEASPGHHFQISLTQESNV